MAKKEKSETIDKNNETDFSPELISALNKEFGARVAYNLNHDESPTHVKRWISMNCRLLDYAIANRRNGGVPEGRIIEIYGPPAIGKSHLAFSMARTVQQMGGLVVYIDTENAVPVERLADMGIDVSKRFVYADSHMTEDVFKIMESTIIKAKAVIGKNIPILIVWDSVAATSPKAELEGDYDQNTMGLQARVISKGMRKITGVIGQNNVTLVCLNQTRSKIGIVMGDPTTTPGGAAIPFHASVRIALTGGSNIKNKDGNVVGINVHATIKKNKVAPPQRYVEFAIMFGRGLDESESLFDLLRTTCEKSEDGCIKREDKNLSYLIEGTGAWKTFKVWPSNDAKNVLVEKKFNKSDFGELLSSKEYGAYLEDMIEQVLVVNTKILSDDESDAAE